MSHRFLLSVVITAMSLVCLGCAAVGAPVVVRDVQARRVPALPQALSVTSEATRRGPDRMPACTWATGNPREYWVRTVSEYNTSAPNPSMPLPQYLVREYDLLLTMTSATPDSGSVVRVVFDPDEVNRKRFTAGTMIFDREGKLRKTEAESSAPVHLFDGPIQAWMILAKYVQPAGGLYKENRQVEIPRAEVVPVSAMAFTSEELRPKPTVDWDERVDTILVTYRHERSGRFENLPVHVLTGSMGNPIKKVLAVNNPLHRSTLGRARISHLSAEWSWYLHAEDGCPVGWYIDTHMKGEIGPDSFSLRYATVATPKALGKRR